MFYAQKISFLWIYKESSDPLLGQVDKTDKLTFNISIWDEKLPRGKKCSGLWIVSICTNSTERQIISGRPWGGLLVSYKGKCTGTAGHSDWLVSNDSMMVTITGYVVSITEVPEPGLSLGLDSLVLPSRALSLPSPSQAVLSAWLPRLLNLFFWRNCSFFRATSWELEAIQSL